MLILAFVGNPGQLNTIGGRFLPPPPPQRKSQPERDPPPGAQYESVSDWSVYILSAANFGFVLWSYLAPHILILRLLPMAPTGLALGGLFVCWLASKIDDAHALHPAVWPIMKDAMIFFTILTMMMPGVIRLVHTCL